MGPVIAPEPTSYTDKFLKESIEAAQRRYAIDANGFIPRIRPWLEAVEIEGDMQQKVRELAALIAAFAATGARKMLEDNDDDADDRAHHFYDIAQLAAAIDWHARQARRIG